MGDFNYNTLAADTLTEFWSKKGFFKLINEPTTDGDSCLDNIFTNNVHIKAGVYESIITPTLSLQWIHLLNN